MWVEALSPFTVCRVGNLSSDPIRDLILVRVLIRGNSGLKGVTILMVLLVPFFGSVWFCLVLFDSAPRAGLAN